MVQSGHHDDTPPNIPLITDKVVGNSKKTAKEGVASIVAEAATAIVKACNPPRSPVQSLDCDSSGKGISPLKAVSLRRSCLEHQRSFMKIVCCQRKSLKRKRTVYYIC